MIELEQAYSDARTGETIHVDRYKPNTERLVGSTKERAPWVDHECCACKCVSRHEVGTAECPCGSLYLKVVNE